MATVCLTSSTSPRLSKPERTRPFIVSADERQGEQNAASQDKLPAWRSVASPVLVAATRTWAYAVTMRRGLTNAASSPHALLRQTLTILFGNANHSS